MSCERLKHCSSCNLLSSKVHNLKSIFKSMYKCTNLVKQVNYTFKIIKSTYIGMLGTVLIFHSRLWLYTEPTTDAIFVVRQLQEKYLAANKRLYMAFLDLEKAFDQVPQKVIWWALRKLGVEEWIVQLVQGMYANARSRVRVGEGYSEEFDVKVVTKDQYSAHCSSSLCLKPYHEGSALGSPGKTSMLMTLLSSLNRLRNVSGGS